MYRLVFFTIIAFSFTACQFSTSKIEKEGELLQKELEKIDWSKVDTYPNFEGCDTIQDLQQKKDCFFDSVALELQQRLLQDTLEGKFSQIESVQVLVTVQADSKIDFTVYKAPDSLAIQIHAIDSLLQEKKKDFPAIYPATKRGIPVSTQFVIPVLLNKY
ncbi:hypothetical protein [Myroides sp. LoEW2-1]|uniref:hypothetical protein n=1 Tax=Myroides sp. LoEW2-1 TaxID=2683192 RepID=UPI0013299B73|nr:hypothetical protein [Myroides sp. LoEW2-1]MVX35773.1 hypothetical protein [Myroides sp. LoEW2-1]